ncbi:class 3 adenylate cyclase/tetratricopeptide (TPR) repeat protein [Paenibacillus phyllosphaerae]|uniref:Class 3 adenylate cyclase/tetratricopeptide (TPR) repeat protein n=1 Tax=Paenibacillus phyllosphaerae TaxID=274593 RepID=A0A7W5AU98_9BACL|nr:adenylate/guanylate cyclase domain-containing protein [Paenibacillus phyllosphaerae]MBB3108888.1 class 3 adenylate cyclase/tetratricopeptide (TPR) repeat protein [Paenibacillus phyllosphaerae]
MPEQTQHPATLLRYNPHQPAVDGVVLFVDISGFTSLTKKLTEQGSGGVEQVSIILNACFDSMITAITEAGGEVVNFAGDALLALWQADGQQDNLLPNLRKAAACGLHLQQALHERAILPGLHLSLRMTLSAGRIEACMAGGVDERYELVLGGEAISQLRATSPFAEAGQVLMSKEAYRLLQAHCSADQAKASDEAFILRKVQEPSLAPASLPYEGNEHDVQRTAAVDWTCELRLISVLFIHLRDAAESLHPDRLQATVATIQRQMKLYGGTVHKISLDDKGNSVIAAFGMPAYTHENDAARSVRAALAIQAGLQDQAIPHAIGLATGVVFYGSIGNHVKREYTMIGDTMNLAARLMQLSTGRHVLCDEATYKAASAEILFDDGERVLLKGLPEAVTVYIPSGTIEEPAAIQPLIGRQAEAEQLRSRLERAQQGHGGVIGLFGEAGIGKSHLLQHVQLEAEKLGVTLLQGAADAIEQQTPYYPWRSIFHTLLQSDRQPAPMGKQSGWITRKIREAVPDLQHWLPLLSPVLPYRLPDNEWTSPMTGHVRADNTHQFMIRLLQGILLDRPTVLVIDDGHWIDSASLTLLHKVAEQLPHVLILLAARPESEPIILTELPLFQLPHAAVIELHALSASETLELLAERLQVGTLPEPIGRFILEKSEGHPFFSEELAYALRDRGLIAIHAGECVAAAQLEELQNEHFPTTIQGIVRSRIDRLPAEEQLVLKVASVIGRWFTYAALDGTMPAQAQQLELEYRLTSLAEVNLTLREPAEAELTYLFKHVITQEVSYNMLLHSQRKQLHLALAEWYENHVYDLSPHYSLLAYHWSKAEHPGKSAYYLEKAGMAAQRTGAYREAARLFSELVNSPLLAPAPSDSARWRRMLGEAYMGIGDMAQASEQLGKALALAGRPIAASPGQFKRDLAAAAIRQIARRILPVRLFQSSARNADELLEQARCYWRLAEIAFFINKPSENLYHSLHALNLAERAGASAELAQISGNMCVTAGIMSLHPLAKAYMKQSLSVMGQVKELSAEAWVYMDLSLYYIGIGKWPQAMHYAKQAMDIYERIGNRRYWEASSYLMVKSVAYHRADFAASSELALAIYRSGQSSGNAQAQSWGLLAQAENALYTGHVDEALRLLQEAETLIPIGIGRIEEIRSYNLLALAYSKLGQTQVAQHYVQLGLTLMDQSSPTTYYAFDGYAALVEALLTLLAQKDRDRDLHRTQLVQAMKALRSFAKVFPIAYPRYYAYAGAVALQEGDSRRAQHYRKRAMQYARKIGMPHESKLVQQIASGIGLGSQS